MQQWQYHQSQAQQWQQWQWWAWWQQQQQQQQEQQAAEQQVGSGPGILGGGGGMIKISSPAHGLEPCARAFFFHVFDSL